MAERKHTRGFTLVELLIVMLIIGVLVGILVPTLGQAMHTVRKGKTRRLIKNLELGLEAYQKDFGEYPPSQYENTYPRTGREKLVFHLRGPRGTGWGVGAAGALPDGIRARRTRTYGPYYDTDAEQMRYARVDGAETRPVAFLDFFEPPGDILYFRVPANDSRETRDLWRDNNFTYEVGRWEADTEGRYNYARYNPQPGDPAGGEDEYFNDCVVAFEKSSTSEHTRYHSDKYLLISPGPDGRYGAIRRTEDGDVEPAPRVRGSYDDITNWR